MPTREETGKDRPTIQKRGAAARWGGEPAPERMLVTSKALLPARASGARINHSCRLPYRTGGGILRRPSVERPQHLQSRPTNPGLHRGCVPSGALFPGQSRLNVLCMGLDRNWTDQDMPYSRGTRTDTMMVANLDLMTEKVQVLSIPAGDAGRNPRPRLQQDQRRLPVWGRGPDSRRRSRISSGSRWTTTSW